MLSEYQLNLLPEMDETQRQASSDMCLSDNMKDKILFVRFDNKDDLSELSERICITLNQECAEVYLKAGKIKCFSGTRKQSITPAKAYPEWHGMPEFVQERKRPYAMIRFVVTGVDLDDLCLSFGQSITCKTKSIWFPHKPHRRKERFVYI